MKLTPIKNEYYNCADACIVSVAESAMKDYHFLFYNYFYFNYMPNMGELMASNIFLFDNNNLNILQRCHGVNVTEISCGSIEELSKEIKVKLSVGSFVMVMVDVFYCPWTRAGIYQLIHNPHYILLTNYKNGYYEGIDPFFTTNNLLVNENELHLASQNYLIFEFNNSPVLSEHEQHILMIDGLHQYKSENLDSFDFFKKDILSMDIKKESNGCVSISEIPLLRCIKQLEYNRYCYIEVLHSVNFGQINELNAAIEEMKKICNLWNKLWSLLLKCFIKESIDAKRETLANQIDEIQNKERSLHRDLINYFEKSIIDF